MEQLFENYEMFLREHSDDISSPKGAARMIQDEGMYRAYMETLTDGLDEDIKESVLKVANRNRECLLTESANVPSSSFGHGWTVLSFPILVDIYAEPIIAELCNAYPVNSPVVSIPKVTIKATTKSYDGTTVTERTIPTAVNLVRAGVVEVNVAPGVSTNAFTAAGLSSSTLKMNRRYTMVTMIRIVDNDGAGSVVNVDIPVNIRPDNRSQLLADFTFLDQAGATVNCSLNGNVNYDSGAITVNVITTGGTVGYTYTFSYATFSLRFTPVATMNGRTTVSIKTEMTDVTIDPNEDFLIDLSQETLQDYKSIFKIDVMRTLSEAVKRQVLLNKDYDLSYFLSAAETAIASNGASLTVDLNAYTTSAGNYTPDSALDVLKAVVPKISMLVGIVRKNFNMYPKYLVSGFQTAALLRALQDMMVSMPNTTGEVGWNGAVAQFLKLRILESSAIANNKIYVSTKAPNDALEKSTIVDLIYNPLYVVQEVTDGNTRNFIRSRTMIEVARTEGLGLLTVNNIPAIMG